MAATLDGQTLTLTGFVGDSWWGDGFTYDEVLIHLAAIEDDSPLEVVINSGGGYATDGAAIHALLSRRPGTTNVMVDGVAASAASLIAMAGDTVTMSAGSIMMIHDPASITFGNSADHQKTVEALEALATSYARVYAAKTGLAADECREIMKRETWLTPEQAVAQGFADADGNDETAAVAAFDYRVYAHAPQELRALATANGWSIERARKNPPTASAPAASGQKKETVMTEKPKAEDKPADIEAIKATAAADAVKAERERADKVEALAEYKGRETLAKHLLRSTDMSVDAIQAALAAAPATASEAAPSATEYDRQRAAAGSELAGPGGKQTAESGLSKLISAKVAGKRA